MGLFSLVIGAGVLGSTACGSGGTSGSPRGAAGTTGDAGSEAGAGGSAGSAGSGGSAGAAGSEGGTSCPPGKGDCDGKSSNGCETDIASDPANCGACGASCDGFCQSSKCSAVQVLASDQYFTPSYGGITFAGGYVYWVSSPDKSNQSAQKYQVQKMSTSTPGTPTALVSSMNILTQIVAGLQKVYFIDWNYNLYGVKFDGTGLAQEQGAAHGVQFSNNSYYYANNFNGACYLKYVNVLTSATGTLYSKPNSSWSGEAVGSSFTVNGSEIAYAVNVSDTQTSQPVSYTIYDGSNNVLAQGGGYVGKLLTDSGNLFWVEVSATQGQDQVMKYSNGTPPTLAIKQAYRIFDIAYQYPDAYISYQGGQAQSYQAAIDVFDVTSQTTKKTLLMQYPAQSLAIDGSYLYFFSNNRLVRIKLPL